MVRILPYPSVMDKQGVPRTARIWEEVAPIRWRRSGCDVARPVPMVVLLRQSDGGAMKSHALRGCAHEAGGRGACRVVQEEAAARRAQPRNPPQGRSGVVSED